tara:strand:- start:19896 stop:25541 length:5646 start_codon:yes stop_codon:yes gene_type:complete
MGKPTNELIDDGVNKIPLNSEHNEVIENNIEPNIEGLNLSDIYNADEKEFESFTQSIDTDFGINESAFTFKKNDKIIQSFDDTEKEDFYEKKKKNYAEGFDNQFMNKHFYNKIGDILPENLKPKWNNLLENRKQKAIKHFNQHIDFIEQNQDNATGQIIRGFFAAYPMAMNELAETGVNIYKQLAGEPYQEFEIFDIDAITRNLTHVDPEKANKNIFKTSSIITRFIVGGNATRSVGNALTGGVSPVTGLGAFSYKPVNYTLKKGLNSKNVQNFFFNRALGGFEDFAAGMLFLDAETENFFKAFDPLVEAVPALDTGLYRWLTSTNPEEEGFIQSKLKFALSEALPIQFAYGGVRGLNRAGRIGFKEASGETIELTKFLIDGAINKFKAIKNNPDLVTAITKKLEETRGFKPEVNFDHLDEIKWSELSLDKKLDELYRRNDIIIESLADEDLGSISYVNRAIGELDVNGNLTEENLGQLLNIKNVEEKAIPYKTKVESGQGLYGSRGKEYLKERLKFLNFKNTFMPERKIPDFKSGTTTILPPIKIQQLSDGDADLLNMFIDSIGDARLRDVSFSINSKISAAGNFDFNKKLISINQKTIDQGDFSRTYIHELWHTLSRYLPTEDLNRLRKEFAKKRKNYLIEFEANKKDFIEKTKWEDFKKLITYEQLESYGRRMDREYDRVGKSIEWDNLPSFKSIKKRFYENTKFTEETYRYKNIDEYFAETMTDAFLEFDGRLPHAPIGSWKRLGQEMQEYFRRMLANLKSKFGIEQTTKIFNDFNSGRFQFKKSELPLEYRHTTDMNKVDFTTYKKNGNRPNRSGIGAKSGDGRGGDGGGGQTNNPQSMFDDEENFFNLPHTQKRFAKYSYIMNRIKSLKKDGTLGKSKSLRSTIENAIAMLADSQELKVRGQAMAEILNIEPLDELNYALAEQITLLANKNTELSKRLKMAIRNEDYSFVDANIEKVLSNMKEIDEWIELAVPIGSKTAQGLRSMQIPTMGIDPQEWAKLSEAEKFKFRAKLKEEIIYNSKNYSKRFSDFQAKIYEAHTEAMKDGDYTKLDNLFGVLNRANGDPRKLQKLFEQNLLTAILNDKVLHPLTDLSINLLLFHPTTLTVNFVSNSLESLFFGAELMLDPYAMLKAFKGDTRMYEENLKAFTGMFTDLEFINEVAKKSWLTDVNIINPRNTKLENVSERAFSSQMIEGQLPFSGKTYNIGGQKLDIPAFEFRNTPLGEAVAAFLDGKAKIPFSDKLPMLEDGMNFPTQAFRGGSKVMTTMDALFQAGALNGSMTFHGYRSGLKLGKTGQKLTDHVQDYLKSMQELLLSKSRKALKTGIIDDDFAEALQQSLEFAKRQTFTEPIFNKGFIFGQVADGANRITSTSPIAKRFMFFLRSPVNLMKRGWRRTPVVNFLMPELWQDLKSVDPLVARQARGSLMLGNIILLPAFATVLNMYKSNDPNNPPRVVFNGTSDNYFGGDWEQTKVKLQKMSGELPESIGILRMKDGQPVLGADNKPVYDYYSIQKLDPISQVLINAMNLFKVADQMPEQTFGEFLSSLSYYTVRSILNKGNMFGIQDFFKFIEDPTKNKTWLQRNILTSIAPRILKDAKHDVGLGLKNTGIMSESDYQNLRNKKMLSTRFDQLGWLRNFKILLDEHIFGAGDGINDKGEMKYPFEYEFITDEKVKKYKQSEGLWLLNWVNQSTSRNNPLITNFKILNYLPEPPNANLKQNVELMNPVDGIEDVDVGLDSPNYTKLIRYINNFTFPKGTQGYERFGNMNIREAITAYFDQPHIIAHMEEIEKYYRNNKVIKNEGEFEKLRNFVVYGDPRVGHTLGLDDIIRFFKRAGKEKFFIDHQDEPFVQNVIQDKMKLELQYRETIKENETFKNAFGN